jgi:putative Mn2+ efflux pump MntP
LPYSKHIVFAIFFILGLRFLLEALENDKKPKITCIGLKCLIGLSIATSMDALIAGTTIKLTSTSLLISCFMFGIFSFAMSETGFWLGNCIKNIPTKFLQIFGGIILIVLAIKAII